MSSLDFLQLGNSANDHTNVVVAVYATHMQTGELESSEP